MSKLANLGAEGGRREIKLGKRLKEFPRKVINAGTSVCCFVNIVLCYLLKKDNELLLFIF